MATSVTQEVIEPDEGKLIISSDGKSTSRNIRQSKFLDYIRASREKPTPPNIGRNISPCRARASTGSFSEMVNKERHATGKPNSPKSGENFSPHYLRASTGSCHDFCKYGRKHEVEVKARRPFPKRAIALPSERQNPTAIVVSAERKITAVGKVKPKPSPVSRALFADSPSFIKQEVSSLSNKVKISSKQASSNEKEIAQDGKKNNLPARKAPMKPKTTTSKPSISPDTSGSLNGGKNSEIKGTKKTRASVAAVKKVVAIPKASLFPKPSNNGAVILKAKNPGSAKFLSLLKDQNKVKKTEPKRPNSEVVLEKTLHVIKVETENEVLECAQNGSTLHSPLSPTLALAKSSSLPKSPALPAQEEEDQEGSEYTDSKVDEADDSISESSGTVNSHSVETSEGNGKRTPGKGRRVDSDNKDCSPAKLKFRRGKVVEVKSDNDGPRRLRFRRGRVLGENQDTKLDVVKRSSAKREVEGGANGTLPGLKGNNKRTPGKSNVGISVDCEPAKLKFRKGKVVDPLSQNSTPRRLRFRRALVLGRTQDSKSDVGKTGLKKRGVEGDANGPEPGSVKVVLRHQDVQGKKDAQGLFNNVIEETASKLVESRKSKVKALVGAFETVISLQESKPST